MNKTILIQSIRRQYEGVQHVLHERAKRIWAAVEARQIGWGGVSLVEEAIGMSHTTIRRGLRELQSGEVENLAQQRSRLPGGRRKNTEEIYTDVHRQRPGRYEPRVLKRRRHRYPLMKIPRQELKQQQMCKLS